MGLLFSALGVPSFSPIYLLLDGSQKRQKTDPMGLNLMVFSVGVVSGLLAEGGIHPAHFPLKLLVVGSLMGLAARFGLLGVTLAARSGLSISVINTSVSLTLTVPFVLSFLLYQEVPGLRNAVGLLLAALCIVLIQREPR
jgi:drug/metabolite transporter (DMT)-like permease